MSRKKEKKEVWKMKILNYVKNFVFVATSIIASCYVGYLWAIQF